MRKSGAAMYWVSVVLGALTVVLVLVNFGLLSNNQAIQAQVNQRQQYINQSAQLSRVSDLLIRTLATEAVNKNDDKVRDMLAAQGVTLQVTPASGAAASGSTPPLAAAPPAATPPASASGKK
jgi:hypothetical protein